MIRPFFALAVSIAALAFAHIPEQALAASLETPATHAIVVDDATGAVLMEKGADEPVAPASMLKLMTIYMVLERLADGSLKPEDTLPVSERAWRMGGSKMFVEVGSRVSIEDLLRGIIVQSGNDACVVVAEGLAGSEEAFAEEMTRRGREIGLQNSVFRNSTGWPDPEQHMTVRDIATLSRRIIHDFPQYYEIFKEKSFTYNSIRQGNRNPLLYKDIGADGLKTGHTEESGYGLAASAVRDERRLVLVINGLDSVNARARESERILEWGFRNFDNYTLFQPGETVEQADVWLGVKNKVPLVIDEGLTVTMHRKSRREMKAVVIYEGPIPAPISAGQEVAKLTISTPESETIEIPLKAGEAVKRLGFVGRMGAALGYLVWGSGR